jgi:hypothetical protein
MLRTEKLCAASDANRDRGSKDKNHCSRKCEAALTSLLLEEMYL